MPFCEAVHSWLMADGRHTVGIHCKGMCCWLAALVAW